MITYKQLSMEDIFTNCKEIFENDKPAFLSMLDNAINLDELVPSSFYNHFYASTGRPRKYSLYSMIRALILQRIFSIPTDSLLIIFLKFSKELRDFCGFSSVPDGSKFTRFRQDFLVDLQSMFDNLVDLTEPICQQINSELASMTIFDTSGIEAFVTENNPKFANRIIKQLKTFKKVNKLDDSYDPYKAAYGSMPSHAAAKPQIQQMYINGHFCYAYKFGVISNGLGIVRDISFYNRKFLDEHPDIIVEKKSDSPDEDKSLADCKALVPVLVDYFKKHPLIQPQVFLGDAAFDTIDIYSQLLTNIGFEKAYIPLKQPLSLKNAVCPINEDGIPCCPKDPTLPMKREGSKSHLRSKIPTMKFVCPKMKWVYNKETQKAKRRTTCQNPCTTSLCGRITYIYPEKNLRAYPGTIRNDADWNEKYKIRTVVEKNINHFKSSYCIANRKTQNEKTLHADLLLAGITQLITVIVADSIKQHEYIRSLKPLIA